MSIQISTSTAQRLFAFLFSRREEQEARQLADHIWQACGFRGNASGLIPELEDLKESIVGDEPKTRRRRKGKGRRKMSAESRERMAKAQRDRWAKLREERSAPPREKRRKRKV